MTPLQIRNLEITEGDDHYMNIITPIVIHVNIFIWLICQQFVVCIETIRYFSDGSLSWKLMSYFIVGYPELLAWMPRDAKHEWSISLKRFKQHIIVLKIFFKEYFWPLPFFLGVITKTYKSWIKTRDKSCYIMWVTIESWREEWRDGV